MLNSTIAIANLYKGTAQVLLENHRIEKFQFSPNMKTTYKIGDIFIGRVQKIVPSLNAAFIEIAPSIPCYYEMKTDVSIGDEIVVQVQKEATKTKVPTITTNLNFTGNYVVLTSENTKISISKKLKTSDTDRLKAILTEYKSTSYGWIARTNAKDASIEDIRLEIENLISEYNRIREYAKMRPCFSCLKTAITPALSFIRDVKQSTINKIVVEEQSMYDEISVYLEQFIPDLVDKLELYEDRNFTLSKLYNLESNLDKFLQKKVWLNSGAYLVVEPTEALTVIDVNSGKCVTKRDKEEQYLKINIEAAIEAAYQIKLRNISGIIIIDFINLKNSSKMDEVLSILRSEFKKDSIQTKVVGTTKLQLVEITRKKTHRTLYESVREHISI